MSDPFADTIAEIDDRKKSILANILTNHQGSDNPITSKELSNKLGQRDAHATNPKTREMIRDLIFDYQFPIASKNTGYFLITDKEEYEEYVEDLVARRDKIDTRIDAFCHAAQENFGFAPDPDSSTTRKADSGDESADATAVSQSSGSLSDDEEPSVPTDQKITEYV